MFTGFSLSISVYVNFLKPQILPQHKLSANAIEQIATNTMNPPPQPPWVVSLRDKCADFEGIECDRVFIDYLDRILEAASPPSQQAEIAEFFKWVMGNYRIRGTLKKVENLDDRQKFANDILIFIVGKVWEKPWKKPSDGKTTTATGIFFTTVTKRLNFDIIDYFRAGKKTHKKCLYFRRKGNR
jgi:hypothetical protein